MLISVLLSPLAHAGWTQPDGAHYTKVGARLSRGWRALDAPLQLPTDAIPIDPIVDLQLQIYTEHGLTDDWTLVAQGIPVGRAAFRDASVLYTGSLQLGVRRGLTSGRHNLSAQVDGGINPGVGTDDLTEGAYPGLVYVPSVRTGLVRGQLWYGVSGARGGWIKANAGAELPTATGLYPAALVGAQLGRVFGEKHRVTLDLPIRVTLGPDDEVANFAGAGNRDFVGLSLSYARALGGGWGVGSSFESGMAAGSGLGGFYIPVFVEHEGG